MTPYYFFGPLAGIHTPFSINPNSSFGTGLGMVAELDGSEVTQ